MKRIHRHRPDLVKTAVLTCAGLGMLASGVAAKSGSAKSVAGQAGTPAIVRVALNRDLKKTILVTARGLSLYALTYDNDGKPICYTDAGYKCAPTWPACVDDPEYHCVKWWPPLTTVGRPLAGKGVDSRLLGVARRRDGRLQVTYNHHPLYRYVGGLGPPPDTRPGDLNGQAFGGLWYAVSPKGVEIR
jgi:predicted lipoprotein with Yx(FWY)xxD motif